MRLIPFLLFFCFCCFAEAQQATNPEQFQSAPNEEDVANKATYFLIDASGSMAERDPEATVSSLLDRIIEDNPTAPVSRTYFRAANGAACWEPIEIGPVEPAIQSEAISISYEDDYTPTGEALKAAILHAHQRGGHADIIIVSDEEPTPGCGIDICAVAQAYLPLENINIVSLQVDPLSLARQDRMGCVDAAQSRSLLSSRDLVEDLRTEVIAPKTAPTAWQAASPQARWYWFVILISATAGFVCFSLRYGERTSQYHSEIARIQRSRRSENDDSNGVTREEVVGFFEPEENTPYLKVAWKCCLGIAGLLSFVLAFLPIGTYLASAQGAAWFVLSSGFASAFAILATTPALFAAGQYWLYDQSKRTYYLISDSADDERKRKARERADQLLSEYQSLRESLEGITFNSPWAFARRRSGRYEINEVDRSNIATLERRAIEVAKGVLVTDALSPKVAVETERLKKISRSWLGFFAKTNFAEFIEYMERTKRLPTENTEAWLSFAKAIRSKKNKLISTKAAALVGSTLG